MNMNMSKQRGLTLVELMIAVVLGMLVTGAVAMLYKERNACMPP